MDMVAYAASFLLGGVSALLVMFFLLFFLDHPVKEQKDIKLIKQIADALEGFAEFKVPQERSQSAGAEKSDALTILPENSPFKDHGVAARRLDMEYNPVPGLL